MTTRTLTATKPGPVALQVDLTAGDIQVIADPTCERAMVTVTALGDGPAFITAVQDTVLRWIEPGHEPTGVPTMQIDVPEVKPTGTCHTVFGGRGVTVVQSLGGVINIGGRCVINGVEITGSGGATAVGRIQITAQVPEGSHVTALTGSASLTCSGEFAEVDFTSTSGDLDAGGVGTLRGKTNSGDVRAAAVDGMAVVRSVSGDIDLGRADDVRAESTSGDVTVNDFAGRAEITTVSGDVRLYATEGATVRARSVSGDVAVTATGTALAEGLNVNATSRSGRVSTPTDTPPGSTHTVRARRPRRTAGGVA